MASRVALLTFALAAASPVCAARTAAPKLSYAEASLYGAEAPRLSYELGSAGDESPVTDSVWATPASLDFVSPSEPRAVHADERAEQRLAGLVTMEAERPAPTRAPPPAAAPYWAGEPRPNR